jgi:hypothetical protein
MNPRVAAAATPLSHPLKLDRFNRSSFEPATKGTPPATRRRPRLLLTLIEILRRFDLVDLIRPFTRCLRCNALSQPIDKNTVIDRLEPLTKIYYHDFRRCTGCRQLYLARLAFWETPGAHPGNPRPLSRTRWLCRKPLFPYHVEPFGFAQDRLRRESLTVCLRSDEQFEIPHSVRNDMADLLEKALK